MRAQASLFSAAALGWGGRVSGNEKYGIEQPLRAAAALGGLLGSGQTCSFTGTVATDGLGLAPPSLSLRLPFAKLWP